MSDKKVTFLFLFSFLMSAQIQAESIPDNAVLVDGVQTAIYGPQRTDIVTYSDLQRPGIDGSRRTLDVLIDRALKDQDAMRYGMKSSPEAIEKNLQAVFRGNSWTEQDFNKMVQTVGWLPEEAREEFRIMTDVNQVESFKIGGQLIVPERDVQTYYQEHPEYESAGYLIARAVVPYDFNQERIEQKSDIINDIKENVLDVQWAEPFWVTDEDIAEDKAFLRTLAPNTISDPQQAPDGFEVLMVQELKPRRLKTIDEMRTAIIEILRKPKLQEVQENYSKELRTNATIVNFDGSTSSP